MVEAEGKGSLARGMKGLEVCIARALSRMMKRKGSVFTDRYHAQALKSPRATARALRSVLTNFARHARAWGERLPAISSDPFSSVRFLAACRDRVHPWPAPRPGCSASDGRAGAELGLLQARRAFGTSASRGTLRPDGHEPRYGAAGEVAAFAQKTGDTGILFLGGGHPSAPGPGVASPARGRQ